MAWTLAWAAQSGQQRCHAPSVLSPQRERQAQREGALELTEKLDQDWKEIQTLLVHKTPRSDSRDGKEKPKVGAE